ncbi:MAG: hypothetical protein Q8N08_03380 [Methanobacteriaceae archaeon]|nr:hypothetical protein [Methanobacteriaceae archaeon]
MKWQLIIVLILVLFGGYLFLSSLMGPVDPIGRLGFVKLANPDMYPGHPHSQLLAQYAQQRGSKCALVVHFAGDSNYRHYKEDNVTIIELAFVDKVNKAKTDIDWNDVLQTFVFGIPKDRWQYKADGLVFDNYDDAMAYVNNLAAKNGQQGPIPMVYHGTARAGNPIINQGCGFPLYVQISWYQYGRVAAYYYILKGMIQPYFSLPYRNFELQHASELQYYYTNGMLDYEY